MMLKKVCTIEGIEFWTNGFEECYELIEDSSTKDKQGV